MGTRRHGGRVMLIPLRLVRDQQLQQQLFEQLRDLIVSGRLQPGSRMPSSRMMAEQFAISRMTVLLTYERLIAEGFLETRPAAGTFVAQTPTGAVSEPVVDATSLGLAHPPADARPGQASSPARLHIGSMFTAQYDRVGCADPSLFPAQRWRSLIRHGLDRIGTRFEREHPAGNPALRDAIAQWLSTSRGLPVSAEQVMLVKGRQQALHLVARLASHPCEGRRALGQCNGSTMETREGLENGRSCPAHQIGHKGAMFDDKPAKDHARIVVEDPCDADAAAAMACEGGVLLRVPVDADGLLTDLLPPGGAALIHVTPEHQRPLGAVLSRERRTALLHWAGRAGALVLEEDIDGELRYGDMNVPSLMSLDRSERVILLGGFGVSLGPWLDVAYMVLPRWLVPYAQTTRRWIDDSRGGLEHTVLAEYLASGGYARHLHRLTKTYASRRDALLTALSRHLDEPPTIWGEQAGLHVAWFPPTGLASAGYVAALARRHGLDAASVRENAVLLGFGVTDEHHIETGIRRLAAALSGGDEVVPPVTALSAGAGSAMTRGAQI
jgi:GntR family transcriptional regulator / MocR family aminotransferase